MSENNKQLQTRLTRKKLVQALSQRPEDLFLVQIMAESYRPAMDSTKLAIEVYGHHSRIPLYAVLNKQIAAKCQMKNGLNDSEATRRQRISATTMLEDVTEVHIAAVENCLTKEEMESLRNERLTRTALFHGLGAKKDLKRSHR